MFRTEPTDDVLESLTEMQRKVLFADPTGNSKRIARKLGLSPHTVDGHFRQIIRRLGVTDRLDAVAIAHGRVRPPQTLSGQPDPVAQPANPPILNPSYELPGSRRVVGVRDVSTSDRVTWRAEGVVPTQPGRSDGRRSPLAVLSKIVLIAVGIVVLGSAALPLGQGFEALAGLILNLRQH